MSRIILTESEISRIRSLYNLNEESNKADFVYGYHGKRAGQEIFDYIREWEGFVEYVYDDGYYPPQRYDSSKGRPKGTLTIGYGTTNPSIIEQYLDKKITEKEAKDLSADDINEAAQYVKEWQSKNPDKRKLTKGMYMALIDMAYNRGRTNFLQSGVLKQIDNGNYKEAANTIYPAGLGIWGNEDRLITDKKLFCREGVCE